MSIRYKYRLLSTRLVWLSILAAVFTIAPPQYVAVAIEIFPQCIPVTRTQTTIVRIISADTLETASGLRVKLAAIEAPRAMTILKGQKNKSFTRRAHKLLTRLVLEKSVTLAFDSDRPDRYGRRTAHVFIVTPKKKTPTWLQAAMIKKGLARAFPNTQKAPCIKPILAFEKDARAKKAGLWKHRSYQVIQSDNLKHLNRNLGRLHLIEGRVHSVSVRRSRTYINFSKDWARDFTVAINRRVHRLFTQSGINIEELTGRRIRVRGWLDRHNGPTIKTYHVAQIEILKE